LGIPESRLHQFQRNMAHAEKIIFDTDPFGVKSEDPELIMHMTLAYICCLTLDQQLALEIYLTQFEWETVNVTFSHVICNNDSIDHLSFIVVVDELSQQKLGNFVLRIEKMLESYGVPIYRPRSEMEPFHSTLGVVRKSYPIDVVLNKINTNITVWNSVPIAIETFFVAFPPVFNYANNTT